MPRMPGPVLTVDDAAQECERLTRLASQARDRYPDLYAQALHMVMRARRRLQDAQRGYVWRA